MKRTSAPESINIFNIFLLMCKKYTDLCLNKSSLISNGWTEISTYYMDVYDMFLLARNIITSKFYVHISAYCALDYLDILILTFIPCQPLHSIANVPMSSPQSLHCLLDFLTISHSFFISPFCLLLFFSLKPYVTPNLFILSPESFLY